MKKYVLDLKVVSVEALSDKHVLIKLTDEIGRASCRERV